MNGSSLKFCLVLIFVSSFVLSGISLDDAFAERKKIISKLMTFENTSIIEFTNHGIDEIKTITIRLGDSSFVSFKLLNNWTSSIASEKSVTFTTSDPLKINETVKFGFKTETANPFLKWEAFDKNKLLVETGVALSEDISFSSRYSETKSPKTPVILSNSTFQIIPNNLHPGSIIRVTGDYFTPHSSLTLYPIDARSKSFVTDEDGHFMLTMKIPDDQKPGNVSFILKDNQDNEKTVSLYVTEQEFVRDFDFTVSDIENEFDRSNSIEFLGTTNPDSTVVIKIKDSQNNLFSTKVQTSDSNGNWSAMIHLSPITPLGTYSAEITDGKNILTTFWDVVTSKKLQIAAEKRLFKSGELMYFNGTATPNEQINLTLIGPQGNSVLSKNFIVNAFGSFEIWYPTTSSSHEGTYVLYAFQNYETEFVFVGLHTYPQKIISTRLNNVNYVNGDVAVIGITGDGPQDIVLSIIDDNDVERFTDKIELGPDGKRVYHLNLSSFIPGVYSVSVSMASFEAFDEFTVDLQYSHEPINYNMIETIYHQGDSIFVTGSSQPYTKIHLFLVDPDGTIINSKDTFTDKNGDISTAHFLIPHGELFGKWTIVSKSGLNTENFSFQVNSLGNEGLSIRVTDIISSSVGTFVIIEGFATGEQLVDITINDPLGNTIFQTNVKAMENGEFDLLWTAPPGAAGKYSITVTDIYGKTASTVIDF